jgi:hypothetical protein
VLTGKRSLVWQVSPSETVGVINVMPLTITRDASAVAFTYFQNLSSLYRVTGLR